MVHYVRMPKLTELMTSVRIVNWIKNEGDIVEEGEPICEAESDKAVEEIPAPMSGVLFKIIMPSGSEVNPNDVIAVIVHPEEKLPPNINEILNKTIKETKEAVKREEARKPKEKVAEKRRIKISPAARKLAEEWGVDVTKIRGTGPGGRIVKEDVLRVIEETGLEGKVEVRFPSAKIIPMTRIRKIIAERLTHSARTTVPATLIKEVDVTEMVKFRDNLLPKIEERIGVRISYTDILIKAVAKALENHPILNSVLNGEHIRIISDINIGVAVATENGLMVPVVHNANKKSLDEIALNMKELIEKARKGKLSIKETTGGTFTITNLGMFGIDTFIPLINPPESAILGVGRVIKKPIVIEEKVAVRSMMTLSLVFDHRVMDGAQAARFLDTLSTILEKPHILLTKSQCHFIGEQTEKK